MASTNSLSLGLKEQAIPLLLIAIVIGIAFLLLKYVANRRHRALTRERDGVTESTFAEHLEPFGFDAVIATSTYRYLQDVQQVKFPILPSDRLDEDLGLDSEDIKQAVTDLTGALGRTWNPGLIHQPLVTVEDLVRLLQASPRAESAAVAA
jgi:acyl carrier protein